MKDSHKKLQRFLMASYLYYHQFTSPVEDYEYDSLARYLLDNYDDWQDHQHAYLVSKGDLQAGTLYAIKDEDYPEMIKAASTIWAREKFFQDNQNEWKLKEEA